MISQEKWNILTPLQNLPKNVGDLGQLVVAKCFKKLPKVQKIAKSGHTGDNQGLLKMKIKIFCPNLKFDVCKFSECWIVDLGNLSDCLKRGSGKAVFVLSFVNLKLTTKPFQ